MTTQNRTTLKTYFNKGDKPTEAQFADLIDSCLNLSDTTSQTIKSPIIVSGASTFESTLTVAGKATLEAGLVVAGIVSANVTGDLTGNVTGSVTGNVTGDVTGNVTGNLTGNVTGNVTGSLTGNADTATVATSASNFSPSAFGIGSYIHATCTTTQAANVIVSAGTLTVCAGSTAGAPYWVATGDSLPTGSSWRSMHTYGASSIVGLFARVS